MKIYLYNTLTKNKEEFVPLKEKDVRIYTCGPTVYDRAHIGNFKAYIFNDLLRKMFKYNGYNIKQVMNITDVGHLVSDGDTGEDKIILAAKKEGKTPKEIAQIYEDFFFSDLKLLNIQTPEVVVRATDEIEAMEEYVKVLLEKGYAYKTSKTIYFDTTKLDKYGVLSKIVISDDNREKRIEVDKEKRNATDFALWIKAPENHLMKWDSFFGESYPGWHLECSVISEKYLGKPFDIHTGGIDHIRYHHENEIAQSKGYGGENPANYWLHSEFLVVDNEKMSKSLGNVYYVTDLIDKGYSPLDFRYFMLFTSYRQKTNFTFEALDSAKISLNRLRKLYQEHFNSDELVEKINVNDVLNNDINRWEQDFLKAINDDLNVSVALSVVWEAAKHNIKTKKIAKLLKQFDTFLTLEIDQINESNDKELDKEIPEEILKLKIERDEARKNKDYVLADELRNEIIIRGYDIIDKENESIIL